MTDADRSVNKSIDLLVTVVTDTDRSVNGSIDLLVTVATTFIEFNQDFYSVNN